jgi:hypothetical protein
MSSVSRSGAGSKGGGLAPILEGEDGEEERSETPRGGPRTPRTAASTAGAGAAGLSPLTQVACGLAFGVSSHLIVSIDTSTGYVGLSISNTRPLCGPSAAEQAGMLAASLHQLGEEAAASTGAAVADGGGVDSPRAAALLAAALDWPPAGDADRAVDPCALGPASQLSPPHNVHHPFQLPADGNTSLDATGTGEGVYVATLHTPDPLSGEAACLHAVVMALPVSEMFAQLHRQRRLPSGASALQLGLLMRDGEGLAVTLLPPPLMATRASY